MSSANNITLKINSSLSLETTSLLSVQIAGLVGLLALALLTIDLKITADSQDSYTPLLAVHTPLL